MEERPLGRHQLEEFERPARDAATRPQERGRVLSGSSADPLEVLQDRDGSRSTVITNQLPRKRWHAYVSEPTTQTRFSPAGTTDHYAWSTQRPLLAVNFWANTSRRLDAERTST
jgi:hypothetical protein